MDFSIHRGEGDPGTNPLGILRDHWYSQTLGESNTIRGFSAVLGLVPLTPTLSRVSCTIEYNRLC